MDILMNCQDQVIKGIEENGVIINRSDIDRVQTKRDPNRKNVYNTLALKGGARAYRIYVPDPAAFNNTTTTLNVGTNRSTFTNDVGFVVLDNDPDVCEKIIDQLANGTFVVVYENKFKNFNKDTTPGDSAFQIVGLRQGLKAKTLENNKYSDDTNGGWNVLLEETGVPESGLFLFDTDYNTTQALIESLINPE